MHEIFPAEEINSAVRAHNMWGMTQRELAELMKQHEGSDMYLGRIIYEAARQVRSTSISRRADNV